MVSASSSSESGLSSTADVSNRIINKTRDYIGHVSEVAMLMSQQVTQTKTKRCERVCGHVYTESTNKVEQSKKI